MSLGFGPLGELPLGYSVDDGPLPEFVSWTTVPLTIDTRWVKPADVPLKISVCATVSFAPVGLTVYVMEPEVMAEARQWSVSVVINGVDVSARLYDELTIEAEENMARVAEVNLDGIAGALEWSGKTISIDYVHSSGASIRIFTGTVQLPKPGPFNRTLQLRCADRRRTLLAQATREALNTWIGGTWSPVVFEAQADSLKYAEALLSTVPAALDLDVYGQPRLTPWKAKETADITLTEDDLLYETQPEIELGEIGDVYNSATAKLDYRYPVLHSYTHQVSVARPASSGGLFDFGYTAIPKALFESACKDTDWYLREATYTAVHANDGGILDPSSLLPGQAGLWAGFTFYTADMVLNFAETASATLEKRTSNSLTERWTVTVTAPDSIDALGLRPMTENETSVTLESEFDTSLWESTYTYDGNPILPGAARSDAELALKTLQAMLANKILASHRLTKATAAVPFRPWFDPSLTVAASTDRLTTKGKLRRVRHRFSFDSGEATSELEFALSPMIAVGTVPDEPLPGPPAAPAAPTPATSSTGRLGVIDAETTDDLSADEALYQGLGGYVVYNRWTGIVDVGEDGNTDGWPDTLTSQARQIVKIVVQTPDIPASSRDPIERPLTSSAEIAIPIDPLTLS